MKRFLIAITFSLALAHGQTQQINLAANSPAPVPSVSASIVGNVGSNTFYYSVVARYPIGNAQATSYQLINAPNVSASNSVTVSWNRVAGATGYDVIKTTAPLSGSCTSCLLASNTTSTSVSDTGQALTNYTLSVAPGATATIQIDNQTQPTPRITSSLPLTTPLAGVAFSKLGTPIPGAMIYCTNCATTNPCLGTGTGAWAQASASPSQWNCAASGGGGGSLAVSANGVLVGNEPGLNFNNGNGITQSCADNGGATRVDCTPVIDTGVVLTIPTAQADKPWYCKSTNGTLVGAYTCSLAAAATLTAYNEGMWLVLVVDNPNSAAQPTINVDSRGVKNIMLADGISQPPAGTIVAGQPYWIYYDNSVFRLPAIPATGTVTNVTGDAHFTITNPTTTPNFVFNPQSGDYSVSQLVDGSSVPITTSGAGAPVAACTVVSRPSFYIDTTNNDIWYCQPLNTWRKILNTSNSGTFSLTAARGADPCGAVGVGLDCFYFNTSDQAVVKNNAGTNQLMAYLNVNQTFTGAETFGAASTIDASAITTADGFKIQVKAGGTAGSNGALVFDSTAGDTHTRTNGVDSKVVTRTATPSTGNVAKWTASGSTFLADDAGFAATAAVLNNAANTGTTAMTLDMSASTTANAVKVPVVAGGTSGADGVIVYDSTNKDTHIRTNGADSKATARTVTPTTGNCVKWTAAGSTFLLDDAGAACGTGGGSGAGGAGTLTYSGAAGIAFSGTQYIPLGGGGAANGTEANVQVKAPAAGTISNLQVWLSANTAGATSIVFTLRDGGADQAVTCTVGAAANTCQDLTHSFAVAQNDLLNVKAVSTGAPGTLVLQYAIQFSVGVSTNFAYTVHGANTWNKPAICNFTKVILYGAGGSGGSGQGASAGNARGGGSGGGGGARVEQTFACVDLPSSLTVTVGTGGAAVTGGSSANGVAGNAGTATTFGSIIAAYGGGPGALGNSTNDESGGAGGGCLGAGSAGTNSNNIGGAPTVSSGARGDNCGGGGSGSNNFGHAAVQGGGAGGGTALTGNNNNAFGGKSGWGGSGGGGGGGVTSANTGQAGGTAGLVVGGSGSTWNDNGGGGAAGGANGGNNGSPGATGSSVQGGGGGGGGGANTGGTGGNGGAGGLCGGAGGGGGGGTSVGGNSGAGGDGCAYVISW